MKCVECGSVINLREDVILRTGCSSYAVVHPCEKCGRLYWPPQGDEAHKTCVGVYNRAKEKAYWLNGQLVHKP